MNTEYCGSLSFDSLCIIIIVVIIRSLSLLYFLFGCFGPLPLCYSLLLPYSVPFVFRFRSFHIAIVILPPLFLLHIGHDR